MKHITETFLEYPDNSSVATIFYFGGCDRGCKGCHNTELQEFIEFNYDDVVGSIDSYCKRISTNKIVLCGGDPLYSKNIGLTKYILQKLSNKYDICIYTGVNIEEVIESGISGYKFIKCGIFDPTQFIGSTKTDNFIRFATRNQKLYDSENNLLSSNGEYFFKED